MVSLARLAHGQWVASIGFEGIAGSLGEIVLGSPAEVEGPQHGNVDAEAGEHQLNAAEHEGCKRCSGKVANEIDDENLPEADDSNYNAAGISVRWLYGKDECEAMRLTLRRVQSRKEPQPFPSCASAASRRT